MTQLIFSRRLFLASGATAVLAACSGGTPKASASTPSQFTDDEWRALREEDWKTRLSP